MRCVTLDDIEKFESYLIMEEKSSFTIDKYLRDVRAFLKYVNGKCISKEVVMKYKQYMIDEGYAPRSVNSMLASVNSLLTWLGMEECKVKNIRIQSKTYSEEEKELTKTDYCKLLKAAGNQTQLSMIIQTIGGTGIRISELSYFTVESVRDGKINVSCKSKIRTILLPGKLKKLLLRYAKINKITSGIIFCTKKGNPIDRTRVWRWMKKLCEKAGVKACKVFPHNLRKLFARTYYQAEKDIAKLADILGHNSINTTRIYVMSTGKEHRKQIDRLGLVMDKWHESVV